MPRHDLPYFLFSCLHLLALGEFSWVGRNAGEEWIRACVRACMCCNSVLIHVWVGGKEVDIGLWVMLN